MAGDARARPLLAETRRQQIAQVIRDSGAISVAEVEERFGVSPMTARRDLVELERQGVARRTHGGAVLPTSSSHEDSFTKRVALDSEAKLRLAEEAAAMVGPEESVYLDSSTTTHYVARRLLDRSIPLTILTNSLAVMELVATSGQEGVQLVGIGGQLRRLTRSFVGPQAVHAVQGHFADRLFFSIKGVTAQGVMTDADPLEAEVKRAMLGQADCSVLLIDQSKLGLRGLSAISSVQDVTSVLVHGAKGRELAPVKHRGVDLRAV